MDKMQKSMAAGLARGDAVSEAVINVLREQPDRSAEFTEAYVMNVIASLLGVAAADLGHARAKEVFKSIGNIMDTALAIIESGSNSQVH